MAAESLGSGDSAVLSMEPTGSDDHRAIITGSSRKTLTRKDLLPSTPVTRTVRPLLSQLVQGYLRPKKKPAPQPRRRVSRREERWILKGYHGDLIVSGCLACLVLP
jgi:hypothetical protein